MPYFSLMYVQLGPFRSESTPWKSRAMRTSEHRLQHVERDALRRDLLAHVTRVEPLEVIESSLALVPLVLRRAARVLPGRRDVEPHEHEAGRLQRSRFVREAQV